MRPGRSDWLPNVLQQFDPISTGFERRRLVAEPCEALFVTRLLAANDHTVLISFHRSPDSSMRDFNQPITDLLARRIPNARMRNVLPLATVVAAASNATVHVVLLVELRAGVLFISSG